MTQPTNYSPPHGDSGTASMPETARREAAEVGRSATERAGDVAGVAGEQARQVASETGRQARHLVDEGLDQLRGQARDGQQKLAEGLRGLADQLRQMSDRAEGSDTVSEAVRQVSQRAGDAASWLEARQPGDLLDEVRDFARRRPGLFLAGAALAGMLAGRLTRNLAAGGRGDDRSGDARRAADADRTDVPTQQWERGMEPTLDMPAPAPGDMPAPPPGATYPPRPAMPPQSPQSPPVPPVPPAGPPPSYPAPPYGAPNPMTGPAGRPSPGTVQP